MDISPQAVKETLKHAVHFCGFSITDWFFIHPLGPPVVTISSHNFTQLVDASNDEHVSEVLNVTVHWTLRDGDIADSYLINISTNAPQTPYGGLLNITGSVTQHELTGFMAGYEYKLLRCIV